MSKPVKSRLGRGLSSLLSTAPSVRPASTGEANSPERIADSSAVAIGDRLDMAGVPVSVDLSAIAVNPHQPRRDFDEAKLAELAASIRTNGLIQPIVIRKTAAGLQLIAGERRLRAAKLAGLATIPAIYRDTDSFGQAQLALVENLQRDDLSPIERASAYQALLDQLGLTQAELAARLGEDRSTIANHLRLLTLPVAAQRRVGDRSLSLGHAKVLAGLSDPAEQDRLAALCVEQQLTVRNLERMLATPASTTRTATVSTSHSKSIEAAISRHTGLRVQLHTAGKQRGRLVLHYATLDEFDSLVARLGVKLDD